MRRVLLILTLLCLSVASFALRASSLFNCVPVRTTRESEVAFKSGEQLNFTIHYKFGFINADIGTASVTLDTVTVGSTRLFHCRVYGQTIKIFEKFFKVREDFNSWFTCDGLRPFMFKRDTREGSYVSLNEYNYVWDDATPYIDAVVYNTVIKEKKAVKMSVDQCTFDLPSLFFFARNIDMSKVSLDVKYPMTFAIDDEIYDVYFVYRGKCVKEVSGLGTVNCLRFSAKLLAGEVFKGDHDMDLYITDDGNRLPVLFGAPIRVGEVEGRMTLAKGLKYPFSSMQ